MRGLIEMLCRDKLRFIFIIKTAIEMVYITVVYPKSITTPYLI